MSRGKKQKSGGTENCAKLLFTSQGKVKRPQAALRNEEKGILLYSYATCDVKPTYGQ